MRTYKNMDIRQECKEANVCFWQIAEYMRISEMTFSRKLRKELPVEEKQKIRAIIAELKVGE